MTDRTISRRNVIGTSLAGLAAGSGLQMPSCFGSTAAPRSLSAAASAVKPLARWTGIELNQFMAKLPGESLSAVSKALGVAKEQIVELQRKPLSLHEAEIRDELVYQSSHIVTYPFQDGSTIDYHSLVDWVASELDIDAWTRKTESTLVLEREIQIRLMQRLWDSLSKDQRQEVLKKLLHENMNQDQQTLSLSRSLSAADVAAISSMSGAGALSALAVTVKLSGFAFYTTMSQVIAATGSALGVTLPFGAYTSAASVIAILSGPIGWALIAVLSASGALAYFGAASLPKTAAAIVQIHSLKVASLQAAGGFDESFFNYTHDSTRHSLLGSWRLDGHRETFLLDLEADGSCTMTCFEVNGRIRPLDSDAMLWEGKGQWQVSDAGLTITRSKTWSGIYWSENRRTLFSERAIVKAKPRWILLGGNAKLVRR